jgi:hypothetical protein
MLAGQSPFEGESNDSQPVSDPVKEPVPLRDLCPEVPEELAAVVEKMLANDPAQRYPTLEAVVEALAPRKQTPIQAPAKDEISRQGLVAGQKGVAEGNGPPATPAARIEPSPPPSDAMDDPTDFELGPLVSDDEESYATSELPESVPEPARQRPYRPAATLQQRRDRVLEESRQQRWMWVATAAAAAVIFTSIGVYALVERPSGKPPDDTAHLEGYLDTLDAEAITGWAWNSRQPDSPVQVDLYDGHDLFATVQADQERDDLVAMQKGNGKHGFSYPTPAGLKDGKLHVIRVRISGSKYQLDASPQKFILRGR